MPDRGKAGIMQLKVLQNTVFKQSTEDSAKLLPEDKVAIPAGRAFEVHSWKPVGNNHLKIALLSEFLGTPPRNTWFVYLPHTQLINSQGKVVTVDRKPSISINLPLRLPSTKRLNVPYKSQLNNAENPGGACNVTSFAMVMRYFQIRQKTNAVQFEDELYRYMERNRLSRHDPEDLAKMAADYGLRDDFTMQGRLFDIRKAIAEGRPCIIHGYFTSFGHIIVIRGYDRNGFFVNDPYGEWTAYGYRKDLTGENLHYSNRLIQSKSSPEGANYIWLHRLAKA
jgi:uncharacterized protein YvpB